MNRTTQARPVAAAIAQVTWGVVLIVGFPILLGRLFGWPLPAQIPTWDTLTSTPLRFIDDTVILNTFVCVAWLCWTILTTYIALGVIDSIRGLPRRRYRVAPLAALAGKISTSLLLLASLTRPVTIAALPAPPVAVSTPVDTTSPFHSGLSDGETSTATTNASPSLPQNDPVYEVQRGDTLWDIAETQLGDPFRWPEIRDLNPQLLANPNLIRSGWQLTMPRDAARAPSDTTPPQAVPPADTHPPSGTELREPPPGSDLGDATRTPPAATTTTTTTTIESPTSSPDAFGEKPTIAPTDEPGSTPSALLANAAGLAGATVLATGLVVAVRRRRRRGIAGPLPFSTPTDLERALVATGDLPLVRWVGQELARLGELVTGQRREGVPVIVEFSEDTGIELLWDQPVLDPPPPWIANAGGWSWKLTYDPEKAVSVAERPSVLPSLVTVGQRNGRQLMVNLEAFGALALVGDSSEAADLFRSMLLELATGDEIAQAQVLEVHSTPRVSVPREPSPPLVDADEAAARLRVVVEEAENLVDSVGCATTFAYRTFRDPVLPLDVTVVGGSADVTTLSVAAAALPAHRAGAVILLGDHDLIGNRIVLRPDGTATLKPLGISFTPAALRQETSASIDALFDDAAMHTDISDPVPADAVDAGLSVGLQPWWLDGEPTPTVVHPADASTGTDGSGPIDAGNATGPTEAALDEDKMTVEAVARPAIMVKVLGTPRLTGGPTVGRRELNVVALVACSSRPVTHEHVQDAIWGASPITPKTVFNLIGSARTALGSLDGSPLLSSANRPDNAITLHQAVGTDLELMRALVVQAERSSSLQAMGLLTEALELVEGPPFDAAGYDWAVADQLVSEAEHLIEHAASMATELALEAADLPRARWAVMQGLRAVPGDEALYRLRMKVEDAAGNPGGVRRAFDELEAHLADYSLSPSSTTMELLRELVGAPTVARR